MAKAEKKIVLWDARIIKRALLDSVRKLNPAAMMRNPVMFVVEVGSVITTILLIRDIAKGAPGIGPGIGFDLQIRLWLWFTVLFANFAEAMAEGRGKAQADNLRKARTETTARKLMPNGQTQVVGAPELRKDDIVIVSAESSPHSPALRSLT